MVPPLNTGLKIRATRYFLVFYKLGNDTAGSWKNVAAE